MWSFEGAIKLKSREINIPGDTGGLLGTGKVWERILDVKILSEVWHEVVVFKRFRLFKTSSIELCSNLLLGKGKGLVESLNLVILSEVWDWVVFWWSSNFIIEEIGCDSGSVLLFSFTNVESGHLDIGINTKVRNEVVSLWRLWLIPARWHLSIKGFLRLSNACLSTLNFSVNSEVWNRVADGPCWVSPGFSWLISEFIPWSSLNGSRSVRDSIGLGVLRQEEYDSTHLSGFKHIYLFL